MTISRNRIFFFLTVLSMCVDVCAQETDQILDMSLEELMQVPVTTATKAPLSLADVPASVSVVTAGDIRKFGYRNLGDVLQAQAGFSVFSDRIYSFIVNRGYYQSNDPNSRVLLLVDGHSMVEGFGYYNGHLASVNLDHVEKIEIVRGPGSALYGTNAMFAVINLITRKGSAAKPAIDIEVGDFGRRKMSFAYGLDRGAGAFAIQGTSLEDGEQVLYFEEYDHPEHPGGSFSKGSANRERKTNISFVGSYRQLSIHGLFNLRKKNVPTGIYGGRFNDDRTFFKDTNQFLELRYRFKARQRISGSVRVYADEYRFKGRYVYVPDPDWVLGPPYESERNVIENKTYGAEILLSTKWSERQVTTYGLEFRDYRDLKFENRSEGDPNHYLDEFYTVRHPERVVSAFASHRVRPNSHWVLDLGGHFDRYKSFGQHFSIRSSLQYVHREKTWFKLVYGEAFRAPNQWEQNGGFFLLGNPDLDPETSATLEFIVQTQLGTHWSWRSSAFHYRLDDSIQALDGVRFSNVEGVTGKGLESEIKFLSNRLTGYASLNVSEVQRNVDHSKTEFAADWQFKTGVSIPAKKMRFGLEGQWMGPRRKGLSSEPELPSYAVVHATLSQVAFSKNLKFSLMVKNLFDRRVEHPSFIGDLATWNLNSIYPVYDIPADGRALVLKGRWTFSPSRP